MLCNQQNVTISGDKTTDICSLSFKLFVFLNSEKVYVRIDNSTELELILNTDKSINHNGRLVTVKLLSIDIPTYTAVIDISATDITPTHTIKYKLANNEFLSDIQSQLLDISARLVSELKFDNLNVTYVKSEVDLTNKTFNISVKYDEPESKSLLLYNTLITDSAISDSIIEFAERALVVIITVIVAILIASIILSGGFTAIAIAQALLAGSAILILGYVVYKIVDDSILKDNTIKNQQAFIEITTKKDKTKEELDKAYNLSQKTKNDCLILLNGYKETDLTYLNEFHKRLPSLEIEEIKNTYTLCVDNLIQKFNSDTINCDTARADVSVCSNTAYSQTDNQFKIKYDPESPYKEENCWIKIPFTEKCLLSQNNERIVQLSIAIIGAYYLYSSYKKSKRK